MVWRGSAYFYTKENAMEKILSILTEVVGDDLLLGLKPLYRGGFSVLYVGDPKVLVNLKGPSVDISVYLLIQISWKGCREDPSKIKRAIKKMAKEISRFVLDDNVVDGKYTPLQVWEHLQNGR